MKWLKENWTKVVLLIGVVVFAFLFFLKHDYSDEYKEYKEKYSASRRELIQVRDAAEIEVAKLRTEREKERREREKIDKEIERIQREKKDISRKLAMERAKVKAMADDQLATAMNNRIGEGQIKLLQMGLFSLKRQGAEKSVDLFIQGEECQRLRKEDAKELKLNFGKIQSLMNENITWSKEVEEKDKVIGQQEITLKDADKALNQLEKDFRVQKWKKRGEGMILGILVTLGVKALIGGK